MSNQWLTPKQAAEILGCSTQTIRAMLQDGLLSGEKVNGRWLAKAVEVERIKLSNASTPAHELSGPSRTLEVDPGMIEVSIALAAGAAAILTILPNLAGVPEGPKVMVLFLAGILAIYTAYTALWLLARYCVKGESFLGFTEIWTLLHEPARFGPYWLLAIAVLVWWIMSNLISILLVFAVNSF